MNVKEVLRKVSGGIAYLPVVVVLAACFGGGGNSGGSGGGSGEAPAQTVNGGEPYVIPASDFVYELSSDSTGVTIREYTGPGGNIIFPTEIEGLPIVEFPDPSHGGMSIINVTSVVFPDYYLPWFESLNPSFVEAKGAWRPGLEAGPEEVLARSDIWSPFGINDNIWDDNDNPLENAVFPKGISYIPSGILYNTRSIKSYTIPDTVKFISASAFFGSGLTSIVIPEGVTAIGRDAFRSCKDLKSVTLPESIKAIGDEAFAGCSNLETVNLPSHKINFLLNVFAGCTKLSLAAQQALRNAGYEDMFNNPY